jgi:hypothetical protein
MKYIIMLSISCLLVGGCATRGPVVFTNGDDLLKAAGQIRLGDTRNDVVCYLGWRKDHGLLEAHCKTEKEGGGLGHPRICFWRWGAYPVSLYVGFTDDGQVYRIHYNDGRRKPDGPYMMIGPDYSKHTDEYIAAHCSTAKKKKLEPAVFMSWDLAVEHLQWRQGIVAGQKQREEIKEHSVIKDVSVGGIDFRIIYLNWRGESRFGIRGSNGPNYVFQVDGEEYKLVGGFHGSRVEIAENDNPIMALAYYHVSAAGNPPIRFPLVDGMFNYVNPTVKVNMAK